MRDGRSTRRVEESNSKRTTSETRYGAGKTQALRPIEHMQRVSLLRTGTKMRIVENLWANIGNRCRHTKQHCVENFQGASPSEVSRFTSLNHSLTAAHIPCSSKWFKHISKRSGTGPSLGSGLPNRLISLARVCLLAGIAFYRLASAVLDWNTLYGCSTQSA